MYLMPRYISSSTTRNTRVLSAPTQEGHMPRRKLELLPRLLSKIDVPGFPDVSPYVGIPIADWRPEITEPAWRWVGAVASRCIIKTTRRAHGRTYYYYANRPAMPAFKVDGKRVIVHN